MTNMCQRLGDERLSEYQVMVIRIPGYQHKFVFFRFASTVRCPVDCYPDTPIFYILFS